MNNEVNAQSDGHLYIVSPRGYSAYEIAVQNGFEGTEEEWLASLEGEQGETGPQGKSAYQVAVDNGFEGTEEDFVNQYINADNYYNKDEVDKRITHVFGVVNTMKHADLKAGNIVATMGYHSISDGGGGLYMIISTDVYLIVDNGSLFRLDNGLYAKLLIKDTVNVKQFGAYGDGTHDDTEIIQNVINKYDAIYIPAGNYIINTLNIPSSKIIKGDGLSKTILTFTNLQNGIKMQGVTSAISQTEFNNISFRSSFSENIIYINNGYGIVFNNCEIFDTSNLKQSNGLVIDGADVNPPTDGAGYYISFINGRIVVCKTGVKMINQANSNLISNVEMYANKQCIYLDNSNGNKIVCNTLQDFLTNAIEIDNTSNLSLSNVNIIIGNYIEALANNEIETGIKLDNDKVRCTQLIANKFNNLHSQNVNEIIDNGAFTLRLDYQNVSPGQEPITLPTFVRINPRGTNFANAYKNEKLFGCIQMFADDEQSGKVMAENRVYDSNTGNYTYYWSELLGFNDNNRYDLTNKTIQNGTLLNTNILLYGGKFIKLGSGTLPEYAGAMMYDDSFKRPKFYDGSTTRYLQYNAAGPSSGRSAYQGYGFMMFDTTLGKPIWYNGSNWVDASGTQV